MSLYEAGAGFTSLAQQNAAVVAQIQSLEAAAAASQQQQQQAHQQHHAAAAAAAAAAAVAVAQQQVQAQQQQQMMNELLYGYQPNAAAVAGVQGMMGLPNTSAPLGMNYGSFTAESVEWQLWQQHQQHHQQQQHHAKQQQQQQ
jgi:hypothetical protein